MGQAELSASLKTCSRCGEAKPRSEFRRARTRDGLYAYCRHCCAAQMRDYRRREPERFQGYERNRDRTKRNERDRKRWAEKRSEKDRESRRRFATKIFTKYSLSLDEYDALVNSPCQMCGDTEDIVLDHCHESGQLRGPLCKWCNLGLGYFKDDPARLRAAANYIEQHRERR